MSEKENEPKSWEEWLHVASKEMRKTEDNLVDELLYKTAEEIKKEPRTFIPGSPDFL